MRPLGSTDPTTVGSYRLLGVLGGGGMGRVYLGRSPTGRRVAIKVIRAELAEDPVFRRRFAREVAAVRSVGPLFTAPMVDADPDAEPPWLATTYVDGPSLREWVLEHGPLAPAAVLMLAAGLAEALASIHGAGLVHRDLKPSNVLLDDPGPRIIDFGIVALPDATSQLTTSLIGTPSYLAPELIDGAEASAASDVFALGATLFFAATGLPLVGEGTMFQQLTQITVGRFDLSQVPKALRPAIVRCLSRRPKDRPTADELARIFISAGVAEPGPGWYRETTAGPVPDRLPGGRLSRRWVLAMGGAVGATLVGGGVGVAAAFDRRDGRPGARSTGPGTVLWLARSGAQPLPPPPAGEDPTVPIIVHQGSRLITASGSHVTAVDTQGHRQWTRDLPASRLTQHLWDDAVLLTDLGSVWLVDAATGAQRFAVDLAAAERAAGGADNPDHLAVEISGVVATTGHAYLNVGTATVAIDRQGHQLWRRPRPTLPDGRRAPAASPLAADPSRLLVRRVVDATVQLSLFDPDTGDVRWSIRYAAPERLDPPPGPPPDAVSPPGGVPPPDGGPPPPEPEWQRSGARIGAGHVALRDAQDLRVVRVADGGTVWHASSPLPVAAIELAGELFLVAADRLTAYHVGTGERAWQFPIRGARLAVTADGGTVVAVSEQGVSALDAKGQPRWQAKLPGALAAAVPDRVTIQGGVAYATFRPRRDRREPLDTDVLAITVS
jgi:outer membrane protein assembly factor BamB